MKYEEEEIKDQTTVLLILNFIIAIILGIAIFIIWSVDHVYAQGQYRMTDMTNSWTNWENISIGDDYGNSTNITTNWNSYIQLKDTTVMESNKTYNFNTSLKITIIGQGDRELFSSIVPYIYNGSTLTDVSDKCSMSGTKSDSTSSGLLPQTTHIYNANINCVGLKGTGYYPYITIRFKANTNTLLTTERINVSSWNYSVGTDSTDANNIMNNANQNATDIINANNQNSESIINNLKEKTQEITNAIQNQYKVCNNDMIYRLNSETDITYNGYLNENGTEVAHQTWKVSDYYRADGSYTTIINFQSSGALPSICFYTEDKTLISCQKYNNQNTLTIQNPTETYYFKASFNPQYNTTIRTTYCFNALEKESEQLDSILNYNHNYGNQPNTSNTETTHQNEQTMTSQLDGNLTNVNIDIDGDSNNIIWQIIARTVEQNMIVFTMVLTILSLGIVKLILGR